VKASRSLAQERDGSRDGRREMQASPACPVLIVFGMTVLSAAALTLPACTTAAARFGANRRMPGAALGSSSLTDWKLAATSHMADRPSLVAEVGKRQ
jgi:hypothetical protein